MKKEIGKQVPTRKSGPKTASRKTASAPRASKSTAKSLLSAGIKALGNAQSEAIARQSRVFESILGLDAPRDPATEKTVNPLAAALDPFGFRKFEDVFDQRVARTLQRLGVPSTEAFAALSEEVERLKHEVANLKARPKPSGDKR